MADKATRYNSGKVKYSMIDLTCLEPCAKVLEFGAKKYARDNWKKGLPISEVLDSLLRHVAALQRGEFIDPESGLSHIGHIQCNALFLGNPKATNDIELNNLIAECSPITQELHDKIEKLVEGVQVNIDDELGFRNESVNKDWSRNPAEWHAERWWEQLMVEKIPVSFEEYDAFVYTLEHSSEPNNELKQPTQGTKYDICGHTIGEKKDD